MAFTLPTGGTRYNLGTGNCVPKKPVTGYTPVLGHLTKRSTAGNDQVDHAGSSDIPTGSVFSINSGNGLISNFEFRTCELQLEYSVAPTRGQQIQANGSPGVLPIGGVLIDQVKGVNSGGIGEVVGVDDVAVGFCTVRFP